MENFADGHLRAMVKHCSGLIYLISGDFPIPAKSIGQVQLKIVQTLVLSVNCFGLIVQVDHALAGVGSEVINVIPFQIHRCFLLSLLSENIIHYWESFVNTFFRIF
jgi:hypothetical protein